MRFRLFVDQCVPRSVVDSLTSAGNAVDLLRTHLPINAKDPDVIKCAQTLNPVLLTLNGDFADIINYPPAKFGGIIALQSGIIIACRSFSESSRSIFSRECGEVFEDRMGEICVTFEVKRASLWNMSNATRHDRVLNPVVVLTWTRLEWLVICTAKFLSVTWCKLFKRYGD